MKYIIELSGEDVNLIRTAIQLRLEACEEAGTKHWMKKWGDLLNRFNKRIKSNRKDLVDAQERAKQLKKIYEDADQQ